MTYEKIKNSIVAVINKKPEKNLSGKVEISEQIVIYLDPEENNWNRAAIEMYEQNLKVPSQRQNTITFPVFTKKESSEFIRMSTNEWNALALELVKKNLHKQFKKKL